MKNKKLMKGNEVIAEAAIRAGCRHFFGYPITPQTEISHYMAKKMPKVGGVFLQAESEVAAINMVYGAAGAGARVMTSSSSPGVSLKQEGISYIASAEVPCVLVDIVRNGPGLGGIMPSQSDYFQLTKGGGHGDYNLIVYAPASVQELYECTVKAFNKADKYRMMSVVMGDGVLGQMMEVVNFKDKEDIEHYDKKFATTGTKMKRKKNYITSIYIDPAVMEKHNIKLQKKYDEIKKNEVEYEEYMTDDADFIIVAYGTVSRIVKNVIEKLRKNNIKAGLIRPITVWPFPTEIIKKYAKSSDFFLCVEMSAGQMIEDVKLAVNGEKPVFFKGRMGGMIPTQQEIYDEVNKITNNMDLEYGGQNG